METLHTLREAFQNYCTHERASLEQQLELFETGICTIRRGGTDITDETKASLKASIARLDALISRNAAIT